MWPKKYLRLSKKKKFKGIYAVVLTTIICDSGKSFPRCFFFEMRLWFNIKKSGSTLITKGFVLILKTDLTWPFLTIVATSSKLHAGLSKVRISIRAASLNVRKLKDLRKDKFSPGECMLVVLSMQAMWLTGITVAMKKLKPCSSR